MDRDILFARLIALHGVRNSRLEDLHSGIFPSSEKGDFSDVKVVTPFGEIPWKDVSRISDPEMRNLMLDVECKIAATLKTLKDLEEKYGTAKLEENLKITLFDKGGASWDR